jgi:hypothetical protein
MQAVCVVGVQIFIYDRFFELLAYTKTKTSLSVYLTIFSLSQVFQFFCSIDAVLKKNSLQLIALWIFNWLNFLYSIVQYFQIETLLSTKSQTSIPPNTDQNMSLVRQLRITIIALTTFIAIVQTCLAIVKYKLFKMFGWSIYRVIGADYLFHSK